jgi:RHS repeat-associated protein
LQTAFTGHKQNDEIGLIYMNARYYLGYINRFLSADTIVPDQTNPQSFNRYSYSLNNPIKFVDPTGHYVVDGSDATYDCTNTLDCQWTSQYGDEEYYPCHNSLDCVYPENFENAGELISGSPYDALVLGASANVKQFKFGSFSIGAEALINFETKEFTSFFIFQGSVGKTWGSSANMFFYGGGAGNLEGGNYSYRGPYQTVNASASNGLLGAAGGRAWVPGDDPFNPELPYADVVGWAPGLGTGVSYSESEYVPLLTTNWETGALSVDFIPYAQEQWISLQTNVANMWDSLWD